MPDARPVISEAQAERMADRMVWNRLERSAEYRHAESAEAQAAAEDRISGEVWRDLNRRYRIDEHGSARTAGWGI